ncbi:methylase of chemotaxis methyl-accepting protein [Halogeometricum borinquense DSM 11551]|uniref:protein-glutamate O-methyltransferase n=2 Tax=Halogeometricum borinquense TaxID=60847 RepID=E4NP44_HALBP|nr:protein-glutamate O-methyltransferase CheR [Halogeometricum borinquense]ADQ67585.1 methylase of chemotaxis methyl-accepting protein [Halogeometricum borinquense DSM 11551]ELY23734.1 methylase of chemotaxis methyl-accepting protein [Halogeometricum borinquense DSM 11551]RYJ13462.1 protein-glutamate O-methyltransferase CheR [Halogeometricum borinquense]
MARTDSSSDPTFRELLDYVESSLSFATSSYNDAYLDRRISARMRRRGVESYDEYQSLLDGDEEEQTALLNALSVNVTSFFRNPEVWDALREVIADIASDGRVNIWSAACSDGREAYSMAMLAHDDDRIDPNKVKILGTDIKPEIIRAARAGEYHASETNDIEEQLEPLSQNNRYVERDGDIYRVTDEVKSLVSFRKHDLVQERPPDTFDLVVCRNLFIYINSEAKQAIFDTLGSALTPDGYLTIGMTETIPPSCRDRFDPVEKRLRIYRNAANSNP